ncbi:MAG: transcription-repair coupling factor [Erysipelotrichales bacterium]
MGVINKLNYFNLLESDICELDPFEEALLIKKNFENMNRDFIIIKNNLYNATKLYNELINLLDYELVSLFGFDESLVVETIAASPELSLQRAQTLFQSLDNNPKIIITHALSVVKPIIEKEVYDNKVIKLKRDYTIDFEDINKYLSENGYLKVSKVTMPNEYSIRGNVIDIFGLSNDMPVRIDTFDNEIESIKLFDVANQRSRITLDEYIIYPISIYDNYEQYEILDRIQDISNNNSIYDFIATSSQLNPDLFFSRYYGLAKRKSSIVEYLDNPLIITSSNNEILHTIKMINEETFSYLSDLEKEEESIIDYEIFLDYSDLVFNNVDIKEYRSNLNQVSMNLFKLEKFKKDIDLINKIKEYIKDDFEVYINLDKKSEIDKLKKLFDDNELNSSDIKFIKENLSRGFVSNDQRIVVFSERELFIKKATNQKFLNKFSNAVDISSLDELKPNDYIVHNYHGIGQYVGLIKLKVDNIEKDFLHIIYKGNEKLYIPIEQFNLIKKYSANESITPKISKLGGSDWKKTKLKVQQKIEDMMDELLELYASRQEPIGYKFGLDNDLQIEFESEFEYQLTPDQVKAIEDVKNDMESDKVMDRLICGDVGYGKTEVAIRAIFKAIVNDKQAAFLCPTTILARQHYLTLLERFENYSINVVLLSRNTPAKQVRQIKQDLIDKKIDVVVGTHKLLGKEIKYGDLGLLVVDEEQRFGVKDKEKIKQMKESIDVLSLSATPIPRTLQMSLSGLRQMSLLQTPPINRVPIQTYVVEKNKYLIKEAIERELVRDGQVFYLYNKTRDIESVALRIENMFDNVKVAYIHGKMPKSEVEKVMESFDNNEYNILVCTTIVETGIDIPNANTIIIEDANKFGLAQLYQIKGRVGRSDRVGYAYLMYEKNRQINEEAQKRLDAIKELTQLGSGYKIALRDLAIRGAGDILGKTQAGNIESVGYDMYLEMLQDSVNERKGIISKSEEEIETINIKNTGYIPDTFKLDDDNKINLYQKIYNVKHVEEFDDVLSEIEDVYGKLPASILDLVEKRRFELLLNNKIKVIDESNKIILQLQINVNDKNLEKEIFSLVDSYSGLIMVEIKYSKLHLTINKFSSYLKTVNDLIINLNTII